VLLKRRVCVVCGGSNSYGRTPRWCICGPRACDGSIVAMHALIGVHWRDGTQHTTAHIHTDRTGAGPGTERLNDCSASQGQERQHSAPTRTKLIMNIWYCWACGHLALGPKLQRPTRRTSTSMPKLHAYTHTSALREPRARAERKTKEAKRQERHIHDSTRHGGHMDTKLITTIATTHKCHATHISN
jgi:hypothetical protein